MTIFNQANAKARIQESINLLKNIYPNAKTAVPKEEWFNFTSLPYIAWKKNLQGEETVMSRMRVK
jgi:hypothetical protein